MDRINGPVVAVLVHEARQQRYQGGVGDADAQAQSEMRHYQLRHRVLRRDQDGAKADHEHSQNRHFATPVTVRDHAKQSGPYVVADAVRYEYRAQLPFLKLADPIN